MDNIELFDKYIKGELSQEERGEFDTRLKSDKEFATDFKVYATTVAGICKEAEQENLEFGVAMKKLTKEQLQSIIGKPAERKVNKPKIIRFKPWIWQAASIAAVVVIAFTYSFNVQRNASYSVDNAIYARADINTDLARSGSEGPIDITKMSADELKQALPGLVDSYRNATDNDVMADSGYALAMAYLKLHDRNNARKVLSELVNRFKTNPDFSESAAKWESILELIK